MSIQDKIKGQIVGLALGDALGAPHEFRCCTAIYTGKLEHKTIYVNTRFKIRHELEVGQYTDDTEMSLALISSIITNGEYNVDNITMSYLAWANSGTWCLGKNTRALFKGIKTMRGYVNRYNKMTTNVESEESESNGSLMRCSGLVVLNDLNTVVEDCDITNPTKNNRDVGQLYIRTLSLLLAGRSKEEVYEEIFDTDKCSDKEEGYSEELTLVLNQVKNKQKRVISGKDKGWVLHALYCALYYLFYCETYTEAINTIIKLKGDTDTNAAICGVLWGAYLGYEALYQE